MQKKNRGKLKKKKQKKGGKLEKNKNKVEKKVECTMNYCCNPCCIWVWGNSGFPTPFSYMYNVICNNFWILRELGIFNEFYQIDKFWWEFVRID